jgi:hypothetical protein
MGLHLSRSETVFGLPAVSARDLIVHLGNSGNSFDTDEIKYALQTFYRKARRDPWPSNADVSKAEREAPRLLARMVSEGHVEPFRYDKEDRARLARQNRQPPTDSWRLTEKGRELARVKFIKRMTRAKAVAELQAFIERVEHINSPDAEYAYIIWNAWLYGSLITDATDIGDVDLIYETDFRKGHCGYGSVVKHSIARAKSSGKELDYSGMLNYGSNEIARILKDRRPAVSLNAFCHFQLAEIKGGYFQIIKHGRVLGEIIERFKTA